MKTLRIGAVLLLALAQVQCAATPEASVGPSGLLGEGTAFETPWFDHRGEEEGPTILITGGMHGNEPAGVAAADAIASWTVRRGRLVVAPRMNLSLIHI